MTWRTVTRIRRVSRAADELARGRFCESLPEKSRDEVGELVRSFNSMMGQLEERMRMKEALNLAMEVQQNLLPKKSPAIPGLDITGKSVYCEEDGGRLFRLPGPGETIKTGSWSWLWGTSPDTASRPPC